MILLIIGLFIVAIGVTIFVFVSVDREMLKTIKMIEAYVESLKKWNEDGK